MQIASAIQRYLDWSGLQFTISTTKNYSRYLSKFLKFIGNKSVDKVTLQDVQKFQQNLQGKGLKQSTIFYYSVVIKNMFLYLQDMGSRLNFKPSRIPLPKYKCESWKPVMQDTVTKMMKVNYSKSLFMQHRNELIVKFLFASGVRVSELCNLSLDSIDLMGKKAVIVSSKNGLERTIFWDDVTNEVFVKYLDMRLPRARCNYVFINRAGERISTRQVQRLIKKLREAANIHERVVPHGFRHGFGTRGVIKNLNLRHLQLYLGHKSITSTQVYSQLNSQELDKEYQRVYNS